MNKRLELLAILFWVAGGLYLAGAFFFALIGVLGSLGVIDPKDTIQDRIAGGIGAAIFAILGGALGGGHIIVGTALRRLRPWARSAGLVFGFLNILFCCNAPLGTALGIFTLIVLFSDEVVRLFA